MDIRLVQPALPTVARQAPAGAAQGGSAAVLPKPATSDVPVPVTQDRTSDESRRALVQEAAQKLQDIYVVSDVRFTIFKDSGGQYITRFTNLRDGKVSYIPEYDILSGAKSYAPQDSKMLNIDA